MYHLFLIATSEKSRERDTLEQAFTLGPYIVALHLLHSKLAEWIKEKINYCTIYLTFQLRPISIVGLKWD